MAATFFSSLPCPNIRPSTSASYALEWYLSIYWLQSRRYHQTIINLRLSNLMRTWVRVVDIVHVTLNPCVSLIVIIFVKFSPISDYFEGSSSPDIMNRDILLTLLANAIPTGNVVCFTSTLSVSWNYDVDSIWVLQIRVLFYFHLSHHGPVHISQYEHDR